eukprot:snap_masked-scaffold_1-processed-gene-1.22-mRNA-1 protein AED:1.00 eAED:1.00 QI:0/0/0/0/1/1/2/0/92
MVVISVDVIWVTWVLCEVATDFKAPAAILDLAPNQMNKKKYIFNVIIKKSSKIYTPYEMLHGSLKELQPEIYLKPSEFLRSSNLSFKNTTPN